MTLGVNPLAYQWAPGDSNPEPADHHVGIRRLPRVDQRRSALRVQPSHRLPHRRADRGGEPGDHAGGNQLLETIVAAAEVVAAAAAGYSPSVLAASPENLIALRLMSNVGTAGTSPVGWMRCCPGCGEWRCPLTSLGSAFVLDPSAAGTLHSSPVRMAAFEEHSGKTITSTVRIESNGLFLVQRLGAIAEIAVSSEESPSMPSDARLASSSRDDGWKGSTGRSGFSDMASRAHRARRRWPLGARRWRAQGFRPLGLTG